MLAILTSCMVLIAGWASQYGYGVFEQVIATRQAGRTAYTLPTPLPVVDGYGASVECNHIGDIWHVRTEGTQRWYSVLIADCSGHAAATRWMTRNNILIELNPELVLEMGGHIGRGLRVEVKRKS